MNQMKDNFDKLATMGNKGYDNLRELGEIQMNTWNQLMEKQMEAFNTVVDTAMAQAQLATEAKDYQEAARGQVELTRKLAENMIGKGRESVEVMQKAGEEYRTWVEGTAKEAANQVNEAVEKVAA